MLLKQLFEGFMDYSVGGSDSAADLWHAVEKHIKKTKSAKTNSMMPEKVQLVVLADAMIEQLKIGLADKGNAYNTHGTLNVAMILLEEVQKKYFAVSERLRKFTLEVANTLEKEVAGYKERDMDSIGKLSEYTQQMEKRVPLLKKLAETPPEKK